MLDLRIPDETRLLVLLEGHTGRFTRRIQSVQEQCKLYYAQQQAIAQMQRQPEDQEPIQQLFRPLPLMRTYLNGQSDIESINLDITKYWPWYVEHANAHNRSRHNDLKRTYNGAEFFVMRIIDYVLLVQRASMFEKLTTLRKYVPSCHIRHWLIHNREFTYVTCIGSAACLGLCDYSHAIVLQRQVIYFMEQHNMRPNFNDHEFSVQLAQYRFLERQQKPR